MDKYYNLLDEPWVPVRMLNGKSENLGLIDLFNHLGDIECLNDSSPTSLISEYRLLLVIAHRALHLFFHRWDQREQCDWYNNGFPKSFFINYLETWRDRFWLFHPQHPFMQVSELAKFDETSNKIKSWTYIDFTSASGNAPIVFSHSIDACPEDITCDKAARLLLGFLQFTPGGLVKSIRDSDKSGPLSNTAAVLPLGENLLQTMVIGLHPYDKESIDLPIWERPHLTIGKIQRGPEKACGPNDRYTRISRSILFKKEPTGTIKWMYFSAGEALLDDVMPTEPMAAYREGSIGLVRISFERYRAMWRNLPSFLPLLDNENKSYPAPIIPPAVDIKFKVGSDRIMFLIAGVSSEHAKLLRWGLEQWSLPLSIFVDKNKVVTIRDCFYILELVSKELVRFCIRLISHVIPASGNQDSLVMIRKRVIASPVLSNYFSIIERAMNRAINEIDRNDNISRVAFSDELVVAVISAWEILIVSFGGGDRLWDANTKLYPELMESVHNILSEFRARCYD